MKDTDVAVVGAGCRFPDAWTPADFWANVAAGLVSIRDLTDEQLAAAGVPTAVAAAPDFVSRGTTLPGVADFAGEFFGYPPAEVETIDPQQRIFLEACWEAMEAAGHGPGEAAPVTGVFAGSAAGTYSAALFAAKTQREGLAAAIDDLDLTLGGQADFLTSRVAYKLGLRGPSVSVQTACSSSLYALHFAVLSLLAGECDLALAGGATVLEPLAGYWYQPGGLLSEDGFCRSFDAASTGTSFSSGVGVVALRRLADALADGDPVLAVIEGTAVGNDGADRPGYTAPTPRGVAEVVASALRIADVPADRLRYVEAHGSGTALGDHVELQGLTRGLRVSTDRSGFCGLGSVKSNFGHCGPAAGIAGFLKAVQVVRTGVLPPHPAYDRARDPGMLADSPFFVPTEPVKVTDPDRRVLVNSMGVGGTNIAAVLAPPPAPTRPPAVPGEVVRLVLSGRTRQELDALSRRVADALDAGRSAGDVAYTLRVGRTAFAERRVVTAAPDRLAAALRMPRPPLVRTIRSRPRPAVVIAADPAAVVPALLAALPAGTEVVTGPAPAGPVAVDTGGGPAGPDRVVLAGDRPEDIDEALCTAWLHGVDVRWDGHRYGRGRRLALPTYPFQRRRYWALDRLPLVTAVPAPAPFPVPANTDGDDVRSGITAIWRDLFGVEDIGPDDEFGALGGSSLLSVQMAFRIQQRYGCLVNLHRAGGSRATVRRVAEIVGARRGDAGAPDADPVADGDTDLLDADLALELGPLAATPAGGTDILLTGATGFLGSFLLAEFLAAAPGRVHCLVRAAGAQEGMDRLKAAAARYELPDPDPSRVTVIPGDLRDVGRVLADHPELAREVGHVVHCAARVVFTEPYRVLRLDNVLPLVELLRWMRATGIGDLSFISTVAATAPALGGGGRVTETRLQALDPRQGGYGVSKWAGERLLERAETDGLRVRVFRPGFVLASRDTGACNEKDLIWRILTSGLAVGAHPVDDRGMPMAPVDAVARAIAELAVSPGSVGRAYHLVDERSHGLRRTFELLGEAGLPTEPVPSAEWIERVGTLAVSTGDPVLASTALYDLEGHELGEHDMEAVAWRPWLAATGVRAAADGALLRAGLEFLRRTGSPVGRALGELVGGGA